MKKLFALLVLVCLVLAPAALAENASITWEEVGAAAVEQLGLEGDFVSLSDMGLALWLPSTMSYYDPSEEDAAAGRYALFMDEDQECYVAVDAINVPDMTLDQAYENAVTNGMTEPEIVNINGIDALTYGNESINAGCVVLVDTNCNMIIFTLSPVDSDEGKTAYTIIASSLMPAE